MLHAIGECTLLNLGINQEGMHALILLAASQGAVRCDRKCHAEQMRIYTAVDEETWSAHTCPNGFDK